MNDKLTKILVIMPSISMLTGYILYISLLIKSPYADMIQMWLLFIIMTCMMIISICAIIKLCK